MKRKITEVYLSTTHDKVYVDIRRDDDPVFMDATYYTSAERGTRILDILTKSGAKLTHGRVMHFNGGAVLALDFNIVREATP